MSKSVESYETNWNELTPCPKCKCRVLKETYSTVYIGHGPSKEYSHQLLTIQCPNCDYDTEIIEDDDDDEPDLNYGMLRVAGAITDGIWDEED